MKPYQAEKNMGRMKHFKYKFCKMLGDLGIKTKASALEAKTLTGLIKKQQGRNQKELSINNLTNEI